jgi:hypothetical protein
MDTKTLWAKRCLTGIGLVFCGMAVLQTALALGDASWIAFFGAPGWVLTVVQEGGVKLVLMAVLAIGCCVGIACYCFSGGGLIRPLPGRRVVLFALGGVLLLWGLRVFQMVVVQLSGAAATGWQIFIIRGAPLVLGVLLLWAVLVLNKELGRARGRMHRKAAEPAAKDHRDSD